MELRALTQTAHSYALLDMSKTFDILYAGDGKTHYIVEKLKGTHQSHQVTIAVNEAFSYMTAIEKLSSLPSDHNGCAIFFNFTVVPPLVSCCFFVIGLLHFLANAGNFYTLNFRCLHKIRRILNTMT